ncbi:MAG: hypothetical protein WD002_05290 [Pseudomonadales bacterium]
MNEQDRQSTESQATSEDSKVDAIAAVALVLLGAAFCLYWVSVQ